MVLQLEPPPNLDGGGEVKMRQYCPQVSSSYWLQAANSFGHFILPTALFKLADLLSKVPLQLHFTPLS